MYCTHLKDAVLLSGYENKKILQGHQYRCVDRVFTVLGCEYSVYPLSLNFFGGGTGCEYQERYEVFLGVILDLLCPRRTMFISFCSRRRRRLKIRCNHGVHIFLVLNSSVSICRLL